MRAKGSKTLVGGTLGNGGVKALLAMKKKPNTPSDINTSFKFWRRVNAIKEEISLKCPLLFKSVIFPVIIFTSEQYNTNPKDLSCFDLPDAQLDKDSKSYISIDSWQRQNTKNCILGPRGIMACLYDLLLEANVPSVCLEEIFNEDDNEVFSQAVLALWESAGITPKDD